MDNVQNCDSYINTSSSQTLSILSLLVNTDYTEHLRIFSLYFMYSSVRLQTAVKHLFLYVIYGT
jgi:hypothetical protein